MNRQKQIQLTPTELTEFFAQPHKAALATVDKDGFPHVVAMGYMAKDGAIYMTPYGKAQKVMNIRRNPKVGVMIETGKTYADFVGVLLRGTCEIIEEPEAVARMMRELAGNQGAAPSGAVSSAPKRVV